MTSLKDDADAALSSQARGPLVVDDDVESVATWFDQHAGPLHRYLTARVGAHDADDLVAQTFLIAVRRQQAFDPALGEARAWLFGIATNELRHHHRQELRYLHAQSRALAIDVPAAASDDRVADRLDADAAARRVAADLRLMSAVDRDILLLNAWSGLTLAQIAVVLDLPSGTVRSRLSRARQALRSAHPKLSNEESS